MPIIQQCSFPEKVNEDPKEKPQPKVLYSIKQEMVWCGGVDGISTIFSFSEYVWEIKRIILSAVL